MDPPGAPSTPPVGLEPTTCRVETGRSDPAELRGQQPERSTHSGLRDPMQLGRPGLTGGRLRLGSPPMEAAAPPPGHQPPAAPPQAAGVPSRPFDVGRVISETFSTYGRHAGVLL